jgi:hypothetical protein
MVVEIRAKAALPDDHPMAPWKKGDVRTLTKEAAELLMRERTEDFEIVEKAPKKVAPKDGAEI